MMICGRMVSWDIDGRIEFEIPGFAFGSHKVQIPYITCRLLLDMPLLRGSSPQWKRWQVKLQG